METLLVGLFGLGAITVVAFVWNDREQARPGTVLRHLLWAFTVVTSATSVANRAGALPNAVTVGGLVAAPVVVAVGAFVTWRHRHPAGGSALFGTLLAYSAAEVVSVLVSGQVAQVASEVGGLVYLPGLAVIAFMTRASSAEMLAAVRRTCLLITYASVAIFAANPALAGRGLPRRFALPGVTERIAGATPHPNILAIIAALALLLVLAHRARWWQVHALAAAGCLVLAESRNMAIALAMALICYWMTAGRAPMGRVLVGLPLLGAGALLLASIQVTSQTFGEDTDTFNNRSIIWDVAWRYFPEKPVFGWGPFAFDRDVPTPFSRSYGLDYYFPHAHNQFVQAAIEAGVLGAAAMVAVVVVAARLVFRRPAKPLLIATTALVFVYMFTEVPLTVHIYGFNIVVPVLAMILIMYAALDREPVPNRDRRAPARAELHALHSGR